MALSVVLAAVIAFVDLPLLRFSASLGLWKTFQDSPVFNFPWMVVGAFGLVGMGSICIVLNVAVPKFAQQLFLSAIGAVVAFLVTRGILKYVFARTLPLLYIRYGYYGFYWLQSNPVLTAFPSTHMAQLCGFLSVLWYLRPLQRFLYVAAAECVAVLLILGCWHYLGDIISGAIVGIAAGRITVSAAKRIAIKLYLERHASVKAFGSVREKAKSEMRSSFHHAWSPSTGARARHAWHSSYKRVIR